MGCTAARRGCRLPTDEPRHDWDIGPNGPARHAQGTFGPCLGRQLSPWAGTARPMTLTVPKWIVPKLVVLQRARAGPPVWPSIAPCRWSPSSCRTPVPWRTTTVSVRDSLVLYCPHHASLCGGWQLLVLGKPWQGGDLDGQGQGRVGLRAGARSQDVPGGRAGQVPVRNALWISQFHCCWVPRNSNA